MGDEHALSFHHDVVESRVETSRGTFRIVRPASADALIRDDEFERDERLPYWAELWPSSVVLASEIPAPRAPGATRMIELGCGLGLVAIAAHAAGWNVLATDYDDDALRFTRHNLRVNGVSSVEARELDWRDIPAAVPRFDLVVAADVLYERRYASLVAHALDRLLDDDGEALIADPGRTATPDFLTACTDLGLAAVERRIVAYVDGAIRQSITLFRIERAVPRRSRL